MESYYAKQQQPKLAKQNRKSFRPWQRKQPAKRQITINLKCAAILLRTLTQDIWN